MSLLEEVTDGIYAHCKGETIGNVGIISTDAGNFIIDSSMYPEIARKLRIEMEAIGTGNIASAILTHYHLDHSGGNQIFVDEGIHAHNIIKENMMESYKQEEIEKKLKDRDDYDKLEDLKITYPTKLFETNPYKPEDSETIEIYHVGGHTSGSSIITHEESDTIFAGDNLFSGRYPWGGDPTASPYDWINALDFIIDKSPSYIIPGHGDVQYNLKEVEYMKSYIEEVISSGKKLVKDGVSTEKAIESLSEIDYHDEHRDGLKEGTLKRWYSVITLKIRH